MICLLSGEEVTIPDELLQSEASFREILNFNVFESLTHEEQSHLKSFLPTPEGIADDEIESYQYKTMSLVFDKNEKFKHGNPVHVIYDNMKNGLLQPKAVEMARKTHKLKYKIYKLSQKEYFKKLVEEIICSRQKILKSAVGNNTSQFESQPDFLAVDRKVYTSVDKVNKKCKKILKDIAHECGDATLSSDDDLDIDYNDGHHESKTIKSSDVIMPKKLYRNLLNLHKRRRFFSKGNPELFTSNTKIADIISRCSTLRKVGIKQKSSKFKKKPPIRTTTSTPQKTKSTIHQSPKSKSVILKKKESSKKQTPILPDYPVVSSFFGLIGYLFSLGNEKKCTLEKMKEDVHTWQSHKSSELCTWKMFYPDWMPLVTYAFDYMCGKGTSSTLKDFIPLITWSDEDKKWQWNETDYKSDMILPLFDHWQETLSHVMAKVRDVKQYKDVEKKTIDTARTGFVVKETSEEFKKEFRKQETDRYKQPFNAFIYNTHGYQSIVGPVKGVFSAKDISTSRAREHAMLIPDRPPYVTILCLVRDAVARLPNGEGTRGDISILLKDSQYLNSEATVQQINNLVSGALDRLHAEKDPCVKFDPLRKVWLYLHRTRSLDEFEKLHQASGAAALAKRQINASKQKLAAKQKKLSIETKEVNDSIDDKKADVKSTSKNISETVTPEIQKESPSATKKKPLKRKKSSATDTVDKPKIQRLDSIKPSTENDEIVNRTMENEALMATQSILNDPDDLFGSQASDTDFLSIGGLSPSLSFETNLNTVLNDFDESLFSGEKLSVDAHNSTALQLFSNSTTTSKSNSVKTKPTSYFNNSSNSKTTPISTTVKKPLPHLSDILSEKANSILKPPTVKTKNHTGASTAILQNNILLKTTNIQKTQNSKQVTNYKKQFMQNKSTSPVLTSKKAPSFLPLSKTEKASQPFENISSKTQFLSKPVSLKSPTQQKQDDLARIYATPLLTNSSAQLKYRVMSPNDYNVTKGAAFYVRNDNNLTTKTVPSKTSSTRLPIQTKGALQNLSQFITTKLPSTSSPKTTLPLNNKTASSNKNIPSNTSILTRPFTPKTSQYQFVNIKGSSGNQVISALPTVSNASILSNSIRVPVTQTLTSIQTLLQAVNKTGTVKPNVSHIRPSASQIEGLQSIRKPNDVILPRQLSGSGKPAQFIAKLTPANTRLLTQAAAQAALTNLQFQRVGSSAITPVRISLPENKSISSTSSQIASFATSNMRTLSSQRYATVSSLGTAASQLSSQHIYPRQQSLSGNQQHSTQNKQNVPRTTNS